MESSNPYRKLTAVVAACVLAIPLAACTSSTEKKIVFEVTGPPEADITFSVGTDQTQNNGAKLPWKHEATSSADPLITVVMAQNKSTGDIVCKITIDGKVAKENKASGEFAIVTCSNEPA